MTTPVTTGTGTSVPAKLHGIRELVGDLEATELDAILATGASVAEIEAALVP